MAVPQSSLLNGVSMFVDFSGTMVDMLALSNLHQVYEDSTYEIYESYNSKPASSVLTTLEASDRYALGVQMGARVNKTTKVCTIVCQPMYGLYSVNLDSVRRVVAPAELHWDNGKKKLTGLYIDNNTTDTVLMGTGPRPLILSLDITANTASVDLEGWKDSFITDGSFWLRRPSAGGLTDRFYWKFDPAKETRYANLANMTKMFAIGGAYLKPVDTDASGVYVRADDPNEWWSIGHENPFVDLNENYENWWTSSVAGKIGKFPTDLWRAGQPKVGSEDGRAKPILSPGRQHADAAIGPLLQCYVKQDIDTWTHPSWHQMVKRLAAYYIGKYPDPESGEEKAGHGNRWSRNLPNNAMRAKGRIISLGVSLWRALAKLLEYRPNDTDLISSKDQIWTLITSFFSDVYNHNGPELHALYWGWGDDVTPRDYAESELRDIGYVHPITRNLDYSTNNPASVIQVAQGYQAGLMFHGFFDYWDLHQELGLGETDMSTSAGKMLDFITSGGTVNGGISSGEYYHGMYDLWRQYTDPITREQTLPWDIVDGELPPSWATSPSTLEYVKGTWPTSGTVIDYRTALFTRYGSYTPKAEDYQVTYYECFRGLDPITENGGNWIVGGRYGEYFRYASRHANGQQIRGGQNYACMQWHIHRGLDPTDEKAASIIPQWGRSTDYRWKLPELRVTRPEAKFTGNTLISDTAPLTVTFTDQSIGNPTSWDWDFGDGNTSITQSPSHTYTTTGVFDVSLTVKKGNYSHTLLKRDYIKVGSAPTADFSGVPTTLQVGETVNFTDYSTNNPTGLDWNFGDGTVSKSTHPIHTYSASGTYTVTLSATNIFGTDEEIKTNYITVLDSRPVAEFSGSPRSISSGDSVNFSSLSTGAASYKWNFGDGNGSTAENPTHVYNSEGKQDVTLVVTNNYGSDEETKLNYITVGDDPRADFAASPVSGHVPLTVSFTDLSVGASSWKWFFPDGSTSTDQNPSHIFTSTGVFDVALNVTNATGSDDITKEDLIEVGSKPNPDFTVSPSRGIAPLLVEFQDQSTYDPTGWSWDFGDGTTVDGVSAPTHFYSSEGSYAIALSSTNKFGTSSITKPDYINVGDITIGLAPVAEFTTSPVLGYAPLEVTFTDHSTNSPTSWSWDFGDGASSTTQSPTHTYSTNGAFTVTLSATNEHGTGYKTKLQDVVVYSVDVAAEVDFSATPVSGTAPLVVQFTDTSQNVDVWYWSFGNGTISFDQNPSATYSASGAYNVSLYTETNTIPNPVLTKRKYINVSLISYDPPVPPPVAEFVASPTSALPEATITFTDQSTEDPTSWFWTFGDGNTSTVQSPTHAYSEVGDYTVTLVAENAGGHDSEVKTDYISIGVVPSVDFTTDKTKGHSPLSIQFTDTSTKDPSSWDWNFGDGNTSTVSAPLHTYQSDGTYTVSLSASNVFGTGSKTKSDLIKVGIPPVCNFSGTPTSGDVDTSVAFQDISTGDPSSWEWDFGDGTPLSTVSAPSHTYSAIGEYDVSLKVENIHGADYLKKDKYISIGKIPEAEFTAIIHEDDYDNPFGFAIEGDKTTSIQFLDESTNSPTSWSWDFGDGNTSDEQHPLRVYSVTGVFTVSLVATNGYGSDTETKVGFIVISRTGAKIVPSRPRYITRIVDVDRDGTRTNIE